MSQERCPYIFPSAAAPNLRGLSQETYCASHTCPTLPTYVANVSNSTCEAVLTAPLLGLFFVKKSKGELRSRDSVQGSKIAIP